jgi:hypothetical protein
MAMEGQFRPTASLVVASGGGSWQPAVLRVARKSDAWEINQRAKGKGDRGESPLFEGMRNFFEGLKKLGKGDLLH